MVGAFNLASVTPGMAWNAAFDNRADNGTPCPCTRRARQYAWQGSVHYLALFFLLPVDNNDIILLFKVSAAFC